MSLKIMLVEPFGHVQGHFATQARYMDQALNEAGLTVTLVTYNGLFGSRGIASQSNHVSVLSHVGSFALVLKNLHRTIVRIPFFRPFTNAYEQIVTSLFAIWYNSKNRHDVIHMLDTTVGTYLFFWIASLLKNHALVCSLHGSPRSQQLREYAKTSNVSKFKSWPLRHFTSLDESRSALKLFHKASAKNRIAFVCFAKETEKSYEGTMIYSRISFIEDARPPFQGINQNVARQSLGLPLGIPIFLVFGTFHPWKDYETILEAIKITKAKVPSFKVFFCGSLGEQTLGRANPIKVHECEWGESVTILDRFVEYDEVPIIFCAANALLLSYKCGFIQHSGNFLWACQCGIPVIASDVPHLKSLINQHHLGMTFEAENIFSLSDVLVKFLSLTEEEKQEMIENVKDYAKKFDSWASMKNGFVNLYTKLVGPS
jgi:glycosyltransferase involved in cell wall biosynthesis